MCWDGILYSLAEIKMFNKDTKIISKLLLVLLVGVRIKAIITIACRSIETLNSSVF